MSESSPQESAAPDSAKPGKGDALVRIGRLVSDLQKEFPDLSISKVRYLEDRGLIAPARTKGRYRKYSRADIRALRSILSMQRDQYLPLDVIRQRLMSPGAPLGGVGTAMVGEAAGRPLPVREEPTHTLEDVCEALGVQQEFILGLIEFRLLERAAEEGPAFTESDLEIARACQRLSQFQVEPRHLRVLTSAVEREAGLIEQLVTPLLRSGHADKREHGLEILHELGRLFTQLTEHLLNRELRRIP